MSAMPTRPIHPPSQADTRARCCQRLLLAAALALLGAATPFTDRTQAVPSSASSSSASTSSADAAAAAREGNVPADPAQSDQHANDLRDDALSRVARSSIRALLVDRSSMNVTLVLIEADDPDPSWLCWKIPDAFTGLDCNGCATTIPLAGALFGQSEIELAGDWISEGATVY